MTITDVPSTPAVHDPAFAALVRAVFEAGLHPSVVERRWPAFCAELAGRDPDEVAAFDDDRVAALARDERLVRNRAKMTASVTNAQRLVAVEAEHGPLEPWLAAMGEEAALAALQEHFVRVGPAVAARVLVLLAETGTGTPVAG